MTDAPVSLARITGMASRTRGVLRGLSTEEME
jgi:hypothetical protein